ncbi:MAG: Crp/Fnr family transcriptional regulator [Actinomycetota bacterium]
MLIEHQAISEYFFGNVFSADSLFCDLSPKIAQSLTAIKQKKRFTKNEIVFASGELPGCIFFLLMGEAQMLSSAKLTGKNLVRSIEPDEILGLTEAIANLPYETLLKTVTPCLFECIQSDDFFRFLQNEPEVCFRLLQRLGANLQKVYQLFARQS